MTILLLVVAPEQMSWVESTVIRRSVPGWREKVSILQVDPVQFSTLSARTERILFEIAERQPAEVLIAREVGHSSKKLTALGTFTYQCVTGTALQQRVLYEVLDRIGVGWRSRIESELRKWMHGHENVDRWLQQFETLGDRWVGETLLKIFEVVDLRAVSGAMDIPLQDRLGKSICFSYMDDQDAGSSGVIIKHLLDKKYRPEDGQISDLRSALERSQPNDVVYFFEDGLWTGTEMRKVFNALSGAHAGMGIERLSDPSKLNSRPIHLRFSVVTDFGLLALRKYLHANGFANVSIDSFHGQRFIQLLKPGAERELTSQFESLSIKDFDEHLRAQVEPWSFSSGIDVWGGKASEAQVFCHEIGSQLIEEYARVYNKTWKPAELSAFALGGASFGTATAFSHSIPKTCLPLLWTGSKHFKVQRAGKSIAWLPLVADKRLSHWE